MSNQSPDKREKEWPEFPSALKPYRKKPVVVQAIQWFDFGDHPAVIPFAGNPRYEDIDQRKGQPWIKTLEGGHFVTKGDWIIEGVEGEHYPCKPEIFAKTYEPAVPSSVAMTPDYIKLMAEQIAEIAIAVSGFDRPRSNRLHAIASDVMRLSERSAITENVAALTAQLAEAREKLAAYEEPARRRERLNGIVAFLFPRYDARKPERPAVLYPGCRWWNGAGIDENDVDVGSAGYGAHCKVTSYIGGGEYDSMELDIPAAWMEAEDFKPLVVAWVNEETARRKREETAATEAKAEADLKDAQRRLDAVRKCNRTP